MRSLVLATRGSPLALAQTDIVVRALQTAAPATSIEARVIKTEGDRRLDVSLDEAGGQGLFVGDIEQNLREGACDLAVHSLKDMPAVLPPGLTIGAVLERGDPRDVLVSSDGRPLAELAPGARIGTDSRRRSLQLKALRPDVVPLGIRGNVDTRIRKASSPEYDAVCLAAAGLERLGLLSQASQIFSFDEMLPAVGQAVLAVEARSDDRDVVDLLRLIDHTPTRASITAERAFLARLGAGCRLPVGAFATVERGALRLRGLLGDDRGCLWREEETGPVDSAEAIGQHLAGRLVAFVEKGAP